MWALQIFVSLCSFSLDGAEIRALQRPILSLPGLLSYAQIEGPCPAVE